MSGRPKDPFEIWASDTNYPAGAADWNGTPTRVRPSSGEIADGFKPDASPPAQWANYALGRACDFVDYLERIEVVNWRPALRIGAEQSGADGFIFAGQAVHVAGNGTVRIGGTSGSTSILRRSTDGGLTWVDVALNSYDAETVGDGAGVHLLAANPGYSIGAIVALPSSGAATNRWIITRNGGTWSDSLVVSSRNWRSLEWIPRESAFLVTGEDTTTSNGWIARVNVSDPPTLTPATITSVRGEPIHLQAHNDDVSVVLDLEGWAWTATSTPTTWTPRGHVIPNIALLTADTPLGLAWWESAGVFIVVTDGGLVYTSEDGAVWSEVYNAGSSVWTGCIACLGGVCLAERTADNLSFYMSVDAGVTWDRATIGPIQGGVGSATGDFGAEVPDARLIAMNGRFAYVRAFNAGTSKFSQSLKVRL